MPLTGASVAEYMRTDIPELKQVARATYMGSESDIAVATGDNNEE